MTSALDPLSAALAAVGGYVLGGFPSGPLLSRLAAGVDIRRYGSGATGATNVLRVHGWRLALPVLIADVGKGAAAAGAAYALAGAWAATVAGLAAVVGHVAPVWSRFRGGKGVATAAGAAAVLAPAAVAAAVLVFAGAAALGRRVSIASLAAAATLAGWTAAAGAPSVATFGIGAAAVVAAAHVPNVRRLLRGEEPPLGRYGRGQPAPRDDRL